MQIHASTPEEYIDQLPQDRKDAMSKLRQVILQNLPAGFAEAMTYGMISSVVTHNAMTRTSTYEANLKR
jgi:hypothetical protein